MSVRSSSLKLWVKRWSRRSLATATGRGGRLSDGLRILTYHRITDDLSDPFAVPPADFSRQAAELAATGVAVSLSAALSRLHDVPPHPLIVLTFDDGTEDFIREAVPVLARWDLPGFGGRGRGQARGGARVGQLRVTTTHLRPGYVRRNGVPYGANATLTEYFVHLVDRGGQEYLAMTSMLDDPTYFQPAYIKTYEFKKQRDDSGWNPTACSAK